MRDDLFGWTGFGVDEHGIPYGKFVDPYGKSHMNAVAEAGKFSSNNFCGVFD